MQVLGPFVERILATAQVTRLVAAGPLSDAARQAIAGFQPIYMPSSIGFVRG
jgi:hypothetical protein